jgi:transcriptional regulator
MQKTELSRIGIQISDDLKADVKIKCAKEGKTIREVVEDLLKKWVKK